MNILSELQKRFQPALAALAPDPGQLPELLEMIRPSQIPKHGDYQVNCAMPLAKQLGQAPPEVAARIVERVEVADLCHEPEIKGPGFINLRLKDEWIAEQLEGVLHDE